MDQVTYVKGYGRFADANTIEVDGLDGSRTTWKTKNTIIATGFHTLLYIVNPKPESLKP